VLLDIADFPSGSNMIDQAEDFGEHAAVRGARVVDSGSIVDGRTFGLLVDEIGNAAAHQFLGIFVSETTSRLQMLRQLSLDADKERAMIEAHSLKSAAAIFGFEQLSEIARHLEREWLNVGENEYHAILNQLDAAFERVCARLPLRTPIAACAAEPSANPSLKLDY
jgi:histidine phosphotransfer protein HptB